MKKIGGYRDRRRSSLCASRSPSRPRRERRGPRAAVEARHSRPRPPRGKVGRILPISPRPLWAPTGCGRRRFGRSTPWKTKNSKESFPRIRIQGLDSKDSIFKDSISRIRPQGFDFQEIQSSRIRLSERDPVRRRRPAAGGSGWAGAVRRRPRTRSAARAAGPTTVRPPTRRWSAARRAGRYRPRDGPAPRRRAPLRERDDRDGLGDVRL